MPTQRCNTGGNLEFIGVIYLDRWGGGTAASDASSLLNFSLRSQVSSCGEQRQELVGEALAALLEVDEGDGDRMMVGKGR